MKSLPPSSETLLEWVGPVFDFQIKRCDDLNFYFETKKQS